MRPLRFATAAGSLLSLDRLPAGFAGLPCGVGGVIFPRTLAAVAAAGIRNSFALAPDIAQLSRPGGFKAGIGLRWSDIDLRAGMLTVNQARVLVEYRVRIEEPKSCNGKRTLPLDGELVAALIALRTRQLEEGTIAGTAHRSGLAELEWYQGGEYVITDEARDQGQWHANGTVIFARTGRRAYHLAVPPFSASSTELERQRARIDVLFRDGWILPGPDRPETARQSLPFIKEVGDDAEVIITGRGARQCVAALFSHQSFPGVRFGHRFTSGDKHAPIWLKEEIETGALHRMMQAQPAPDDAGIVWTAWGTTGASDP